MLLTCALSFACSGGSPGSSGDGGTATGGSRGGNGSGESSGGSSAGAAKGENDDAGAPQTGDAGATVPTSPDGVPCNTVADEYCASCGGCAPKSSAWEGAFNLCRYTPCKAGFIPCWIAECDAQKCTQYCK